MGDKRSSIPVKGVIDIVTHTSSGKTDSRFGRMLRASFIEMQRDRILRERAALAARLARIDARVASFDAELAALLPHMAPQPHSPRETQVPADPPQRNAEVPRGFRLRY